MSWAEWKIEQYNQGEKANWLERHCLDHANPVHFVLSMIGAVPIIHGLWIHNMGLVFLGFIQYRLWFSGIEQERNTIQTAHNKNQKADPGQWPARKFVYIHSQYRQMAP